MKGELANQLLAKLLEWSGMEPTTIGGPLQTLARFKYDDYEGFRPGEKFLESLAGWLLPFTLAERRRLVTLLLDELVFISRPEMDHLIDTVYPDLLRRSLVDEAAASIGVPSYRVAEVAASPVFRMLQRSTLVCGLSDGARLDRLRRTSRQLSHEQFHPNADLTEAVQDSTLRKLREATGDSQASFRRVLLVEDFSGSGFSLLRSENGSWDGKLWRSKNAIDLMVARGVIAAEHSVHVLVYVASRQAERDLRANLQKSIPSWLLDCVMSLGDVAIVDAEVLRLASRWFDRILETEHLVKGGGDPALGFAEAALPLVLFHNTPNNSISLLWGDSTDRAGGLDQRALFPREERHRADL